MHSRRIFRTIYIITIFSALSACTGPSKHNDAFTAQNMAHIGPVNGVIITFSDKAQAKLETNNSFDENVFNQTIINALDKEKLFNARSNKSLEIVIKSISTKPKTSIVFSDVNSEAAHVKGSLIIKNELREIVVTHDLSTEYLQEKSSNRHDKFRPDWLYTEFANQTTQTLTGKLNNKSSSQ
jgi:hypothetical protein